MKLSSVVAGGMTMAITAALPALVPALLPPAAGATSVLNAGNDTGTELAHLPAVSGSSAAASENQLLVKVEPSARTGRTVSALNRVGDDARRLGGRWYLVKGITNPTAARERLADSPGVVTVQRDRVRRAFGDQYYRQYQGYLRASMDINTAWNRSSGRGVKVAVLDTGVDAGHEDLKRVLRGRDFVDGDRKTQDPVGHGTFVAGVIGAERDNHHGIAGVSRASILPGRVLNAKGFGHDGDIAQAIRWAVREHADIINLSLGGGRGGRILRDAIHFATRHDVLVVASAGNSGGTRPMYPAAFSDSLAVGATDQRDRMVSWSQHGDWVDVMAPGSKIVSTVPGDRYAMGSGTSFSAPLVSGSAALVLAKHPHWSVDQLRGALLRGAADAGPVGPDTFTGLGVPDVDGMLGGPARGAVPLTGELSGTAPGNARELQKDSVIPATSPEGTDRWFELALSSPTRLTISATLRRDKTGEMRGDVELSLYDTDHRRLDVADARKGDGIERVTAVVDDNVFVRVRNLKDTRWPDPVKMGLTRESAGPGQVQSGGASRPVLISSAPLPESYGAGPAQAIELATGVSIRPSSIDGRSVRLIDGETGEVVATTVSPTIDGWAVSPDSTLASGRTYALMLDGLRTTGGSSVPFTRLGFRTAL